MQPRGSNMFAFQAGIAQEQLNMAAGKAARSPKRCTTFFLEFACKAPLPFREARVSRPFNAAAANRNRPLFQGGLWRGESHETALSPQDSPSPLPLSLEGRWIYKQPPGIRHLFRGATTRETTRQASFAAVYFFAKKGECPRLVLTKRRGAGTFLHGVGLREYGRRRAPSAACCHAMISANTMPGWTSRPGRPKRASSSLLTHALRMPHRHGVLQ